MSIRDPRERQNPVGVQPSSGKKPWDHHDEEERCGCGSNQSCRRSVVPLDLAEKPVLHVVILRHRAAPGGGRSERQLGLKGVFERPNG